MCVPGWSPPFISNRPCSGNDVTVDFGLKVCESSLTGWRTFTFGYLLCFLLSGIIGIFAPWEAYSTGFNYCTCSPVLFKNCVV